MIESNSKVAISYNLFANGVLVESKSAEEPMTFITGITPIFEQILNAIAEKNVGEQFTADFHADEMMPPYDPNAVVVIEKTHFIQEGITLENLDEVFIIGHQVPMTTSDGQFVLGTVNALDATTVTMDFNHPLSNKQLKFEGTIISATPATDQEILEEHLANASFDEVEEDSCIDCVNEQCNCEDYQCDNDQCNCEVSQDTSNGSAE